MKAYQQKTLNDAREICRNQFKTPLYVNPFGSEKTAILSEIAENAVNRGDNIIVVHRNRLLGCNPTVRAIVADWLINNGYSGLYSPDCECIVGELMPCGDLYSGCKAGYKVMSDNPENSDCDWHVNEMP